MNNKVRNLIFEFLVLILALAFCVSCPEETEEIVNYEIVYVLNGGSLSKVNPTSYNSKSKRIMLNNPEKTGYTFLGWTGSNGDKPQTNVSIKAGSTGDKTFIANFSVDAYNINYDLNGASFTSTDYNPTVYSIESDNIVLINPTRTGCIFKGWSGTGLSGEENLNVVIPKGSTGDRSFKANWVNNGYKIDFVVEQTEGITDELTNSVPIFIDGDYSVTFGTPYGDLPEPRRTGWDFDGWYTDSNGGDEITSESIHTIPDKRTLYAHWKEADYKLRIEIGNHISSVFGSTETARFGEYVYISATPDANYEFDKWIVLEGDGSILKVGSPNTFIKMPSSDVVITAQASAITYSITYNLDGGTCLKSNPSYYTVETGDILLLEPDRWGYRFVGWQGTDIIGTSKNVLIPGGSMGNRYYIAQWAAVNYAILYELNSGTNNPNNNDLYTVEDTVRLAEPTREGYAFIGWTGSNGNYPQVDVVINKGSSGTKKYYANWRDEKALPGSFSVSESKKVNFARGNLYSIGGLNWFLEDNQYDFRLYDGMVAVIRGVKLYISDGTVGSYYWNTTQPAYAYQRDYISDGRDSNDVFFTNKDDYSLFSGDWKTLSYNEWDYLLNRRNGASSKKGMGGVRTSSSPGVSGLILLPDDFVLPNNLSFVPNNNSNRVNVYSEEEWAEMEKAGAVFLPAAGTRRIIASLNIGNNGYYWTSTGSGRDTAGVLEFSINGGVSLIPNAYRSHGYSIRLVTRSEF